MARVLIVEDDQSLSRVLSDTLTAEGFDTRQTGNGNTALNLASSFAPDLVLLDIGLQGKSGLELCRIRREGPRLPITLTARGQQRDKLQGLSAGADDYVTKPFHSGGQPIARILGRAVLRRARPALTRLNLGDVTVDFEHHTATRRGVVAGVVAPRVRAAPAISPSDPTASSRARSCCRRLGRPPESPHTRSVDYAIARLRRKLERDPHHPTFIHSAYGGGYLMTLREA
ncbi:MAG: response regulator transcription factor [Vicinamibacterales bacterium]